MKIRIVDRDRDGRGRAPLGQRTVLVSQAHPGEEVTLRIDRKTRGTLQGRVQRILEADPRRIAHRCGHEFRCTGCPLLAVDPDSESLFKQERIREALEGIHAFGDGFPVVRRTGSLFGYRHGATQIFGRRGPEIFLGSFVAGTHEVVDNEMCPVLSPSLNEWFQTVVDEANALRVRVSDETTPGLRHAVGRASRSEGRVVGLLAADEEAVPMAIELADAVLASGDGTIAGVQVLSAAPGNALLKGEIRHTIGEPDLPETLAGQDLRVGPRSFFQVNPEAAEAMFSRAAEMAGQGSRVVEGYAGSGALTALLADRFERVTAIERDPVGAGALTRMARASDGRIRAIEAPVEEVIERELAEDADLFVADPPRAGLGEAVTSALASSSVSRILLLACEPKSLRRDLPPLLEAGFSIGEVEGFDQFPRTAHVEVVVTLSRD